MFRTCLHETGFAFNVDVFVYNDMVAGSRTKLQICFLSHQTMSYGSGIVRQMNATNAFMNHKNNAVNINDWHCKIKNPFYFQSTGIFHKPHDCHYSLGAWHYHILILINTYTPLIIPMNQYTCIYVWIDWDLINRNHEFRSEFLSKT